MDSLHEQSKNHISLIKTGLDVMQSHPLHVIWFPEPVSLLTDVHKLIYRFFNLDFFSINGLSFCIWKGASTLDILTFKFVTVTYALLLVIVTIKLMNTFNFYHWCPPVKRNPVKSYVIHGLSALLVMCYA